MTTSAIAYYEATARNPRLTTIQKIANFFEISPDYLLSEGIPKKRGPVSRIDKIAEDLRSMSAYKQRQACNLIESVLKLYQD